MIKKSSQSTVHALLSKNDDNTEYCYLIPPYQREYSWRKEQWDNLFDDLVDNDVGYFLGSVICIVPDGEKTKLQEAQVIDGQQRFTTLNLLLLAVYSKIAGMIAHSAAQTMIFTNRKYNLAWLQLEDYFLSGEQHRLTLSIQNNNNSDYAHQMLFVFSKETERDAPANFGNRRIAKAFKHFSGKIDAFLQEHDGDTGKQVELLFALLEKITSACVVRIDTEDATSAFILFESINNRGMPLTPVDLIKNSMIGTLKNSPEKTNRIWQQLINNLNDYDVQVRYLRHFYQAFKPADRIFDSKKGKEKITKNDLIKIYTDIIKEKKDEVLTELVEKSEIYKVFAFPEDMDSENRFIRYKGKLQDLKKLGTAPSHTLLLYLFVYYPEQDFSALLDYLEQWFMIRHLTNIPATNKLDSVFIEAVNTQLKGYDEDALIGSLSKELPNRERIKQDLESTTLYSDNPHLVRCILTYLEQKQRTLENRTDFWGVTENGKSVWSVEHIYPQTPQTNEEWPEGCKDRLHALGNLTLSAYNSNLSNRSFAKKAHIQKEGEEGKKEDIGLKSGNVKINDYLLKHVVDDQWSAEHIDERGKHLIEQFMGWLNLPN